MPNPYTKTFADYYDIMSESRFKNIHQELEFFQFIFHTYAHIEVKKILDAGCGTGRHSIALIKSGYEVTGLDRSQNMLKIFRKKLEWENLKGKIVKKDMKNMDFTEEFHAIICMNSAFMYLLTDKDILHTLKCFHDALESGGVAIIDIMNFLNLMGRYQENLVEKYNKDGITMERAIKHWVEDVPGIWNHQEFGIVQDKGETMTYHELHRFRMLNYNEMKGFLNAAGFTKIKCFGEFVAREEVKSNSKRLIFVAIK